MKKPCVVRSLRLLLPIGFLLCLSSVLAIDPTQQLSKYFEQQVAEIEAQCLHDVQSQADWEAQRERRREELLDMLGLAPLPERTPLRPRVTGVVQHPEFSVENLHFESFPGLIVTANLYLPREITGRVPAILYASGHANVVTNDIRLGNKVGYQHHGAWFARQGYACLMLDTIQLGEIPGEHHGTYRLGHWWWNSRGYTPAGVEAWTCIRALDYLETRSEVDAGRIGMTGRSGGGSYTWTTAAIDERIRVAAPVAGITDLRNHILDGVVEGHCDCMYFLNTRRWDFALNAALIAPRPLLIVNTDSDGIFPLDGVYRLFEQTRRIYRHYGKDSDIGLVIAPGPHKDSQDLQVPVFRWFDTHLRQQPNPMITRAATPQVEPIRLRVLDAVPKEADHETVPKRFGPPTYPEAHSLLGANGVDTALEMCGRLLAKTFSGWPAAQQVGDPKLTVDDSTSHSGLHCVRLTVEPQSHVSLPVFVAVREESVAAARAGTLPVKVRFLDETAWPDWAAQWGDAFGLSGGSSTGRAVSNPPADSVAQVRQEDAVYVWALPRGVGPGMWAGDERKQTHIRRRFQLLGQTVAGMQMFDTHRLLVALRELPEQLGGAAGTRQQSSIHVSGAGHQACHVLYATLFDPQPAQLELELRQLPNSHLPDGPDYLRVLQVTDIPEVLTLVQSLTDIQLLP